MEAITTPWGVIPDAEEVPGKGGIFEGTGVVIEVVRLGQPRLYYRTHRSYAEIEPLVVGWQSQHNFLLDKTYQGDVLMSAVVDLAPRGRERSVECVILYPLYEVRSEG